MSLLYTVLVVIHVFSAIIGLGPGFSFIFIKRSAKSLPELKQAYQLTRLLHRFVMVGGFLLLATGLAMGAIQPRLFHMGWYCASLALFILALAMGPLVLTPRTKRIRQLLTEAEGDRIPEAYERLAKEQRRYEWLLNTFFLVIIFLMITKPF
ncbi:DUF2269 family protein [Camelliibacillus cellulosilyticus]|uniref:DUF2269 family protein n=1 Tax=Camelliibacillus cellulosilyticus TaxID=2174486 RepID=A0ABV9GI93_9BACL